MARCLSALQISGIFRRLAKAHMDKLETENPDLFSHPTAQEFRQALRGHGFTDEQADYIVHGGETCQTGRN